MTYEISTADKAKLDALDNAKVMQVIADAAALMKPAKVVVFDDSAEDIAKVRQLSIDNDEEKLLEMDGHTIHYDGYFDQGRDKANTATLLPAGQKLSRGLNVKERESGLGEILGLMDGVMAGKEMIVRFFCLGPTNSRFSISSLQITDSYYVAHSEDILYRPGYEEFKRLNDKNEFFYFWHSAGELGEDNTTANIDKRRIYIDPQENRVLSVNNQYAGNSLACKKLSLRLAINKANKEDWLTEHMFISAFYPLDERRKTYFMGAYPSGCGKTSTAMIEGSTIVGDDIAYIREGAEGEMRAVNIERGIFGIIGDVNAKDDPLIFKAITEPKELIFSNILTTEDGKAYWSGMGKDIEVPTAGFNHAGAWKKGDLDAAGKEIPMSHPNSRFTTTISELDNADENYDNPNGVAVDGIFYGGRDSDTNVPISESLSWEHGVFVGATIESETTATTLGATGKRASSPMANMDFVIVPLSLYLNNHIKFGNKLKRCPKVFSTNYFLKNAEGQYMNEKTDKRVWALWAEGRVHGEYEAIETPVGLLPKYEDLKVLFDGAFDDRDYTLEEYNEQFSIRTDKYLAKLDRMEELFSSEDNMPEEFWTVLKSQRASLEALAGKLGTVVAPSALA
ncbi:MAG: phosphoenolpyruvate carboxykinase (GTP) [Anaerolineae bacterium]|jgi:phosphoenolpyruvate carboxykinase (GTP)|nr:phosphoenolpyruvate carboxykinase (GTP) [Anaerolineae bacterium]MBT7075061.1 phosphoenolpyruvate carboxykinase (GTP) [Anaerolineae bacterium]MBT7781890.1 phosphoenolpyruvate carboxykinase (GTP) [Anaerolineae bacterium]